jgi:hypothetical protein
MGTWCWISRGAGEEEVEARCGGEEEGGHLCKQLHSRQNTLEILPFAREKKGPVAGSKYEWERETWMVRVSGTTRGSITVTCFVSSISFSTCHSKQRTENVNNRKCQ